MDELQRMLGQVERSVFRLETLSSYIAPGEADMLRAFNDGHPMPSRGPDTDPWLRMVADSVQAGRLWSRVHVLNRPLSDYLRFELFGYQGNVAAGEDVRIADRAKVPETLSVLAGDFWLLDNAVAVVIEYDGNGRRLSMEPTRDVTGFVDQQISR
jgi:hypothetical protein